MVRREIEASIEKALKALGVAEAPFVVSIPGQGFGDYATNAALIAGKRLGVSPREAAEDLVEKLAGELRFVEKIEVAGPGFINFSLSQAFFVEILEKYLKTPETLGRGFLFKGKKIMVEYTSPNLFKPLHIGNLVGNILGESITRLIEQEGGDVVRINYPSDIGLSVAKGVWGLRSTGGDPRDIQALGKAYQAGNTAYEEDPIAKGDIEAINQALYEGTNAELNALRERGIQTSRKHLAELSASLGTSFDAEFFESQSASLGRDIVRSHIADGIFEESEGAVVYKGEKIGLHTRVFLNSKGLPTYEAKEIGLFDLKRRTYPDFDISITVTGAEQSDYFKVVFAALKEVFRHHLEGKELLHIANGFLRLTSGKMSSRKGNIITGESLIDEMKERAITKMEGREMQSKDEISKDIGVASIKYAVLRQAPGRDIVFDPEKSLSLEGDSGPYLQYAHVRACALRRKAEERGIAPILSSSQAVSVVERLLIHFPEAVEHAAREFEPHHVTTYLTELAGAFNSWYAQERIVEDSEEGRHKLAVTEAFRLTMERGLWLLGIRAPREM